MKKLFLLCAFAFLTMGAVNAQEKKADEADNQHGPQMRRRKKNRLP